MAGSDGESVPSCPWSADQGGFDRHDEPCPEGDPGSDPNEGPDNVDDAVASFVSNFIQAGNQRPSICTRNPQLATLSTRSTSTTTWLTTTAAKEASRSRTSTNWRAGLLGLQPRERLCLFVITTAEVERCFNHLRWVGEAGGRERKQGGYFACEMSVNVDRIRPT